MNPLTYMRLHDYPSGNPRPCWTNVSNGKIRSMVLFPNALNLKELGHLTNFFVLYSALKERGFNFEDVNLKNEESLKLLFAVMVIAFCWAYHVGAWLNDQKPIHIKKHQRPAKSVFRYGFDWIRNALFNLQDKQAELHKVLWLLWNALMGPKHHIYQIYPLS
jgi:hypothetical protein